MTRNKERSQTFYASVSIWSNYRMWVTPSLQKAIWPPSTFLPWGNKIDVSLGNTCLAPCKRHQRLNCFCRCVPWCEQDRQLGRCKHPNPACSWSHPLLCSVFQLCNWFIISKKKLSTAQTTGLSWHRTGQRNLNKSGEGREVFPPPVATPNTLSSGKHVRPLERA